MSDNYRYEISVPGADSVEVEQLGAVHLGAPANCDCGADHPNVSQEELAEFLLHGTGITIQDLLDLQKLNGGRLSLDGTQ